MASWTEACRVSRSESDRIPGDPPSSPSPTLAGQLPFKENYAGSIPAGFIFRGVAKLASCLVRDQEIGGSSPPTSTILPRVGQWQTVGPQSENAGSIAAASTILGM